MIVLDTHIWLWYSDSEQRGKLSRNQLQAVYDSDIVAISIMSCWEAFKLHEKKRFDLGIEPRIWIEESIKNFGIKVLTLDMDIVEDSIFGLNWDHKDPMDRIIVATARIHQCPLLTQDGMILTFKGVKSIE